MFREVLTTVAEAAQIVRSGQVPVTMSESDLEELENETKGFRRISDLERDLPDWSQERMAKVVWHLYRKNHMARRIVEITEDFVVGDGVELKVQDDTLAELMKEFWDDPINAMDELNGARVREWQLWGEVLFPLTVNEVSGVVRVGWIDPSYIEEVEADAFGRPSKITLTNQGADLVGRDALYNLRWNDKDDRLEGDCVFRQINAGFGSRRGVSELFTAADWIDAMDEILFATADRSQILNSFIWDVTLKGMNERKIKAWLRDHGKTPAPGSIRAHNEAVEWKAEAPQFGAYETSRMVKDLQNHILGGFGIPGHWYGAGDDANLATAAVMAEPTRKRLRRKQREFRHLLEILVRYQIQVFGEKERLAGIEADALDRWSVEIPDFAGPDVGKVGATVAQVIVAIRTADESGYITTKTAAALTAMLFGELGAEIDPEDELKQLKGEGDDDGDETDDQEKAQELAAMVKKALADQAADPAAAPAAPDQEDPEE